jgi:ubiquinone/menaquinone biosynthesis C-methylase UbiE
MSEDEMSKAVSYRAFEYSGWERAAPAYAATFERATTLFVPALADAVAAKPGVRVLDLACGTGCLASEVAARGAAVVGGDFSPAMIAEARRLHPHVEFQVADAESLAHPDASFDGVAINFGVHHFPSPVRALSECLRVLRAGGTLAFTVWASPEEHALHRIALAAARRAGDAAASLPLPPEGALNTSDACTQLLQRSGFAHARAEVRKVAGALHVESVAALQHLIQAGTVRMAALVASQPEDRRAAIMTAIAEEAAEYRVAGGGLSIPVVALLARAVK